MQNIEENFWCKVKKTTGCWIWLGRLNSGWYGVFDGRRETGGRKTWLAHRYAYTLLRGEIPVGLPLDHLCKNHRCVNPAHLEIVTPLQNAKRGKQAQKSVCPAGHSYAGGNLILLTDSGGRQKRKCRICVQARKAEAQGKIKATPRVKPSREQLKADIAAGTAWTTLAVRYGVSDNGVKKWAVGYGLQIPVRRKGVSGLKMKR